MEIKLSSFWRKHLIILTGFLLFLAIMVFTLFLPLANNVLENKKDLTDRRSQLEQIEERTLQLQKSSNNQDLTALFLKTSMMLPDDPEVSQFIIQLENLSSKDQILIKNLSIDELRNATKGSKTPSSTKFSFDTDATYSAIFRLIKDLENFDRFNSLETITMLLHDQTIAIKVQGKIFYGK